MADDRTPKISDATREADRVDATAEAGAGSMPTAEDEAAAERGSKDVDTDEVAEHYEDMIDKGAHQKGEGRLP